MDPKKTPIEAIVMDWALFLAAYAPMFAIAAIKWEGTILKLSLAACFVIAALPLLIILLAASRQQYAPYEVRAVESKADINAGFLATYLLPFLTTDTPSRNSLIAYAILVWVIGLIFTRARKFSTNPLLYMAGFDIGGISTDRGDFVLISRQLPVIGETISAARLLRGGIILQRVKK